MSYLVFLLLNPFVVLTPFTLAQLSIAVLLEPVAYSYNLSHKTFENVDCQIELNLLRPKVCIFNKYIKIICNMERHDTSRPVDQHMKAEVVTFSCGA